LVSPLWLRHDPQVLGSFATALFDDFIVDDLACLKLSQAGALDGRDVYKTSGAAALTVRLARSGLPNALNQCPLSGVKRTLVGGASMSAFDPKRTSAPNTANLRRHGRSQRAHRMRLSK